MQCCVRPWILLQITLQNIGIYSFQPSTRFKHMLTLEDRFMTLMYDRLSSDMVSYTLSEAY
jgi:hypothetical protein